jgi:hypothetical protein
LRRATAVEELKKEAVSRPPDCEDEFALADRLFDRFVTDEVALRALPVEARPQLQQGNWRWCLLHIRCCIVFGWLVCRGPRTFRAFVYYLHRYWRCVRQAVDDPISDPSTHEQQRDFAILVEALASAFKPYLMLAAGFFDHRLAAVVDNSSAC